MKKLNNEEMKKVTGGNCFLYNLALLFGNLSFQDQKYWANRCK